MNLKLKAVSCWFESSLAHFMSEWRNGRRSEIEIAETLETQAIPQNLSIAAFVESSADEKLSVGRRFESFSRLHYGVIAQRKSNGVKIIRRLKRHRRSEVAAIFKQEAAAG